MTSSPPTEGGDSGQASPWSQLPIAVGPLLDGVLAHGGSGYEQAEAELCGVEGDEVAVALGPPT